MNFLIKTHRFSLFISICLLIATSCKSRYDLTSKTEITQVLNKRVNTDIPTDSNIVNYYLPYKLQLEQRMNHQIGTSAQPILRNSSLPETYASNFFAETLLSIGKQIDPEATVAFGTKGGIRADLNEGPITIGNIFELMPFENFLVVLELSGQDFLTLCNFIAKTHGQPVAGLRMKIKDKKPFDIEVNGKKFDINSTYKLVTYDYLANGGDLTEGLTTPISRNNTQMRIRECIIEYIEQLTKMNKPITAKLDGRITIVE